MEMVNKKIKRKEYINILQTMSIGNTEREAIEYAIKQIKQVKKWKRKAKKIYKYAKTTIEKIRTEIMEDINNVRNDLSNVIERSIDIGLQMALNTVNKYAEQEPCRDIKEIAEIMKCDANTETKCKMISNILTAKPHYFAEQQPCDDVVSRQAVIEMAYDMSEIDGEHFTEPCMVVDVKDIQKLPPVRQQEQTGHWIRQNNTKEPLYGWYFCSECNSVIGDKTKFCSNCGAKMVEPTCDTCEYNTAAFMPCNACEDKSEYKPQESEE